MLVKMAHRNKWFAKFFDANLIKPIVETLPCKLRVCLHSALHTRAIKLVVALLWGLGDIEKLWSDQSNSDQHTHCEHNAKVDCWMLHSYRYGDAKYGTIVYWDGLCHCLLSFTFFVSSIGCWGIETAPAARVNFRSIDCSVYCTR